MHFKYQYSISIEYSVTLLKDMIQVAKPFFI